MFRRIEDRSACKSIESANTLTFLGLNVSTVVGTGRQLYYQFSSMRNKLNFQKRWTAESQKFVCSKFFNL